MARIKIDELGNTSIILDNGAVLSGLGGYTSLRHDDEGVRITFPDGAELFVTAWTDEVAGYNVADLNDGQLWKLEGDAIARHGDVYMVVRDGSDWTRYDDELAVWTPARAVAVV